MEEQTQIKEILSLSHPKSCCFTGHRVVDGDFSFSALENAVEEVIRAGVDTFYCGMARGFDLLAGKCVVEKKKKYPFVKLIACVPYFGQEEHFARAERALYKEVLKDSDEVRYTSEKYLPWCFTKRDEEMVQNADCMIAYLKKDVGGTAYTVKTFQKKKKGYIFFL